jgi:hypothetical protein
MPTISSSIIPPPKSWEEFEDITLSATKIRWKSTEFFGNGRRGQRQDGVDVFGTTPDGKLVGVQCKNTSSGLAESVVMKEIGNAESFEPALSSLYVATTAHRDATLQESIRKISADRKAVGKFSIEILFWEDIAGDLATDEQAFFKHYPQFSPIKNLPKEHDHKLYEELMELLPSGGIIEFLNKNNMAGFSFLDSKLDPLRQFYYEWQRPEREFIHAELESIRLKLWQKADAYLGEIATRTFSSGSQAERRSVPEEWEFEEPELFWDVVSRLHSLAEEIVALHRTLVRTAREYFVGKI